MGDSSNMLASSAITAGSSLASSLLGMWYNNKQWEKQKQFSIDMWNLQNEYNKPINQVARLKEAGLNPMFYGLEGSSASSPVAAPTQNSVDVNQSAMVGANLAKQMAEIDVLKSQAKANNVNSEVAETQRDLNSQLWNFNKENNVYTLRGNKFLVDFQLPQNERLTNAQRMQAENNATAIRLSWDNIKKTGENIAMSTAFMSAQYRDKMADAVEKWSTMEFRKKLVQLGVYETQSRIGLNYAQIANIKQMTANAFRTGKLMDFEIQMNKFYGSSFRLQQLNAIKFSNDRLQFDLAFDRKNKQIGWYIDNACKVVDAGVDIVKQFVDYFNPAKQGNKKFGKSKLPSANFSGSYSSTYSY